MPWYVYLARCRDGTLYTGVSPDPAQRIAAHNQGAGAAYTRSRRPVRLVYTEAAGSRDRALSREWAIKQLTRKAKEELMRSTNSFRGFRPAALAFLSQLKRRNTRDWFEANRATYEADLRDPMRALVEELDVGLARLAPEMVGDPRHSIFRIHRDIRFSKDKSPYKTHVACWLYHRDAGRGVGRESPGSAGFYFHLAPGGSFVGGGIWMPPRPTLGKIREALVADPESFAAIVTAPGFRRRFGALDEDAMLTRLPRGFAAGHPAERWLRYQSFTVGRELARREVLGARLPAVLLADFAALTPLVRWLNGAIGYQAATRR